MRALEACSHLFKDEYAFPIIDPVDGTQEFWSKLRRMAKDDVPCAVIINPGHGKLANNPAELHKAIGEDLADAKFMYPALHIRAGVGRGEIEQFIEYYSMRLVALVLSSDHIPREELEQIIDGHESVDLIAIEASPGRMPTSYRPNVDVPVVLLMDGFRSAPQNALYPDEEFFAELSNVFHPMGFDGFGDYQTIGDNFTKGFIPKAVAIHFSYEATPGIVRMRHFVSIDRAEQSSGLVKKKTRQALDKLLTFVEDKEPFCGVACQLFVEAAISDEQPALAKLKEWSIRHHIELMNHLFKRGIQ